MNFSDKSSQRDYETLLKAIDNNNCAIFIGAGLSIPVKYPSLQGLLHGMAREAGVIELQDKIIDKDWASDFKTLKDYLGLERYRRHLSEVFDHTKRDLKFNDVLLSIFGIPFCAFVTTNYDPCLEFASMKLPSTLNRYSFSYPNLPTSELKGKHIFHPHGYIDPNEPNSINSIILSDDEFIDASEITSKFFTALFLELDVLFVGFGWNDIVILNVLEKAKQTRKEREGIAVKSNLQLSRERYMFALLDNETFENDKGQDNYIGRLGINPIIYKKTGESHNQLNQIMEEIQRKTSSEPAIEIPTVPAGFFEPLGEING